MKSAKLLTINLAEQSYTYKNIELELLGGRGFVAEYYSLLNDKTALVIAVAKFSTSLAKAAGRYTIGYYSLLYNKYRSTTTRGTFGAALVALGLGIVCLQGELASYGDIVIEADKVRFKTETETGEAELPALTIGDSGRGLSPIATVCDERGRQFGGGGLGALFGTKRVSKLLVSKSAQPVPTQLPKAINCTGCYKQRDCKTPKVGTIANKYFIDNHAFERLAKTLSITEAKQLEELATKLANNDNPLAELLNSKELDMQRQQNDKMILADCLGLCGLAMQDYKMTPEEKQLVDSVAETEKNLKGIL